MRLHSRRRIAGFACLFALVLGAVVAPAAHFGYMSVADALASGDMGHTHAPVGHADGGAQLETPAIDHVLCEYATLFASLGTGVATVETTVTRNLSIEAFSGATAFLLVASDVETSLARGPPSA